MANEGQTQDTNAGAGAGTSGTPGASGTPGTQGTPGTTTPGQSAATTATPTGFTYQEDRSKWIPPHRLSEESTKRQQLERDLEIERNRVRALSGVDPKNPDQDKANRVREAFFEMFPQMKKFADLTDEQLDRLLQTPDAIDQNQVQQTRYWERHGNQSMSTLSEHVAAAIGTDALNAEQQADLRDAFSAWLKKTCGAELQASNGAESATLRRYEDGDPKLLEEFAGRYTKNWVEPARRQSTAQQTRRTRPVPNSGDRSQVSSVKRPETFKTLDERIDYALQLGKERGMRIGG